jgi:hypothetical protein
MYFVAAFRSHIGKSTRSRLDQEGVRLHFVDILRQTEPRRRKPGGLNI